MTAGRWIERSLWIAGGGCLLLGAAVTVRARQTDWQGDSLVLSDAPPRAAEGAVMAQLAIPELAMTVPVLNGCSDSTLRRGACRLAHSAEPGGLGNAVVAGHRDTVFRPLAGIKPHMNISMRTGSSTQFWYQVDRTEIVSPRQVSVLQTGERPELTLITCYPFHYIGSAPQRFVVHAHLLSVDGEQVPPQTPAGKTLR